MNFRDFTIGLINRLASDGEIDYGAVLVLCLFAVAVLALIVGFVLLLLGGRSNKQAATGTERAAGMVGRLEKLEKTLNDFKTDSGRAQEFYTIEFEWIRNELKSLKELLETTGGGGGGGGLQGTGGADSGAGSGPAGGDDWELSGVEDADYGIPVAEPAAAPPLSGQAEHDFQEDTDDESEDQPETLAKRLSKSRVGFFSKLKNLFAGASKLDSHTLDELEALLIGSDLGTAMTRSLIDGLQEDITKGESLDEAAVTARVKQSVEQILTADTPHHAEIDPRSIDAGPLVVMLVGVNGVGKTTTTAKLAQRWKDRGAKVMLVAADTFRAAAVEQLARWGARMDVPVVKGLQDAKPATVVYEAMERAKREEFDVVLIDTAGRLHTKSNLMKELEGVRNIVSKHQPGAPHETLLVIDGSTGQNAILQAREFDAAVNVSGIIVTKLDGTPKGGVVVAIKNELGVPIRYIGVGESQHDLRPFSPREFVDALFDSTGLRQLGTGESSPHEEGSHAAKRRRRRRRDTSLAL